MIPELLASIRFVHERIRDAVVERCEDQELADLARVVQDDEGDTTFAIDRVGEEVLVDHFRDEVARHAPLVLVAEGLGSESIVLPEGAREEDAVWRVIVDPIDGTRELMYQKRSAWVLTGVARNRGAATSLRDIELAVQTEIPLVKQHLCDLMWAVRGEGAGAERLDRISGERRPLRLRPSRAKTIGQGFATIARFFPGARDELAAIDEEIVAAVLGPPRPGKALCFEDQYISTGGQLHELMAGHDRFIADLRPLAEKILADRGQAVGICCHPYDICTELIARELGVIITDPTGAPLDVPLTLDANVAWVGYANEDLRNAIEPALRESLKRRGLL